MKIKILTLFKEMYDGFLDTSIIKRARALGLVDIELVDIRDFSDNKYRHVDDTPYGGGAGMLMQVGPIARALDSVKTEKSYTVMMSPKAKPYDQAKARELARKEEIIIICGHYEGIDHRVSSFVDEHISIGDYILTGGELASMVVADSIIRLRKEVISPDSLDIESYDDDLLEYPQYTKPYDYQGMKVPDILLSGDHAKIRRYRRKMAIYETLKYRKDLLKKHHFTDEDKQLLEEILEDIKNGRL